MPEFTKLFTDDSFMDAVAVTADALRVSSEIVLKDFGVFGILKAMVEGPYPSELSELPARLVFKGGTSLSKAYGLAQRFSEDVDLAFINDITHGVARLSQSKQDKFLKAFEPFVRSQTWISSVQVLDKHQGKRILSCEYRRPSGFAPLSTAANTAGYLKPHIKLELDIRGEAFPTAEMPVGSLLGDYIKKVNPQEYEKRPALHPVKVRVMRYDRTMIEKTLALLTCISAFFEEEENARFAVKEKERHFYDIHRLYEKFQSDGQTMSGNEFLAIFRSSVEQDRRIYRTLNYEVLGNGLPRLAEKIEVFSKAEFRDDYKRHYEASPIYFGERLKAEEILNGIGDYLRKLHEAFGEA